MSPTNGSILQLRRSMSATADDGYSDTVYTPPAASSVDSDDQNGEGSKPETIGSFSVDCTATAAYSKAQMIARGTITTIRLNIRRTNTSARALKPMRPYCLVTDLSARTTSAD